MSIQRFPVRLKASTFPLVASGQFTASRAHLILSSRTQHPLTHHLHSARRTQAVATLPTHSSPPPTDPKSSSTKSPDCSPLSCLPLPVLLRNLAVLSLTNSPLLNPSLRLLSTIAQSSNFFLAPSRNPLLRFLLKKTLFKQFCAGENPAEVRATLAGLRGWGIQGIMLGWAREVEHRDGASEAARTDMTESAQDIKEINEWVGGTMQALGMGEPRDCVCVKFTGAGHLNLTHLSTASPPSPTLSTGLSKLCHAARARDITLVIDAEQASLQPGIEAWTLALQREHNHARAFVVGTYQAYLRSTPPRLAQDLATAAEEGWALGIKLVRGAYLGSDPRHLFWESKEATDACYDGLADGVMRRAWGGEWLAHPAASTAGGGKEGAFPPVCLILATHNTASTLKAMAVRAEQARRGEARVPLVYAQLMGMADHVSCELVAAATSSSSSSSSSSPSDPDPETNPIVDETNDLNATAASGATPGTAGTNVCVGKREANGVERPRPYKYLVWGSLDECLKYLLRRAEENRDAVARTEEGRVLLWRELRRRAWG